MQDNLIYILLNSYNNVEGVFIDEIGMTKKPINKKNMKAFSEVRKLNKLQGSGIKIEVSND